MMLIMTSLTTKEAEATVAQVVCMVIKVVDKEDSKEVMDPRDKEVDTVGNKEATEVVGEVNMDLLDKGEVMEAAVEVTMAPLDKVVVMEDPPVAMEEAVEINMDRLDKEEEDMGAHQEAMEVQVEIIMDKVAMEVKNIINISIMVITMEVTNMALAVEITDL